MAEKKLIEGFWDCEYCESKGISGLKRDCPFCGKPRGDHVTFYMKQGEQASYLSEEQAEQIADGPDWYCEYCGSLNSSKSKYCTSCGAEREETAKDYFDKKEEAEREAAKKAEEHRKIEESYAPPKKSGPLKYVLLALLIAAAAFLIYSFLPKKDQLTVEAFHWKYSINLMERKLVEESNWSLPAEASLITTREEIHHYETVIDGYDTQIEYQDNGNGTFREVSRQVPITHQEPVYETKYYYSIYRWFDGRSVVTEAADHSPYWGEVRLAYNEQERSRSEIYQITALNKSGKENVYQLSKEDWTSLEIGDRINVEVSMGGNARIIEK